MLLSRTPKLYDGIECESSLYLFEKDNILYIALIHITTSMLHIYIMDIITYLSIIAFILKTQNDYEIDSESYPDTLQFSCNIIQLADKIFNIIAKGFFMDQGSYLVSTFQVFDFIYQVSNIIAFGGNPDDFKPILKILLYLGYFRPMKLMYRLSCLTRLREAIGRSLFDIFNVIITLLSVWIMFGVYGIILYEQFGYCEDKMAFEVNKETCLNEGKILFGLYYYFQHQELIDFLIIIGEDFIFLQQLILQQDYSVDWIMIYYKSTQNDNGFQLLRLFFSLRSLRIILIFQGFISLQRLINVI